MALTFKFRYDTTDLNLQAGTSGLQLAQRGWLPQVPTYTPGREPPLISETMRLNAERDTTDNLAASIQALNLFQKYAAEYYVDPFYSNEVWLHSQMTDETSARRAAVRSIEYSWGDSQFGGVASTQNLVALNTVVVRSPAWENPSAFQLPSVTPSAAVSVKYDYTNAGASPIAGTMPARVGVFQITNNDINATLDRFWIGLRSANKHGDLADFETVWECEDGTNAATGSDVADGGASGGFKVVGTPSASDTWERVFTISLSDVVALSADYVDNFGRFMWLLREEVSSSSTFQIQLRWGYSGLINDEFVQGEIFEVDNTDWDVLVMGTQSIPLNDMRVLRGLESLEGGYEIQVWMKRTSASGTISFDCLAPVPVDEGYLVLENCDIAYEEYVLLGFDPFGRSQALSFNTAGTQKLAFTEIETPFFQLPVGEGNMIIVAARNLQQIYDDGIILGGATAQNSAYERWMDLRGDD